MNSIVQKASHAPTPLVSVRSLSKAIKGRQILNNVNFDIEPGRVVGFLGPNGAGKTTTIKAALGFTSYEGDIRVMGLSPRRQRHQVMASVSFISDVGILPRWLRVDQAVAFMAGIHPKFQADKARALLAESQIRENALISTLSKGMVTQLHLALVLALDVDLLVLDEPTLGLDLLYRESFYRQLYERFLSESRSLLISTHQIEEIEFLLSDLIIIDQGQILLNESLDSIADKFQTVEVRPEALSEARSRGPIFERVNLAGAVMIFSNLENQDWSALGRARQTSLAELFVALVGGTNKPSKPNLESQS